MHGHIAPGEIIHVPYKQIRRMLKRSYSIKKSSSEKWMLKLIEHVNRLVQDEWYALSMESVVWKNRLHLPWHCHGDLELVPAQGASPIQTAEWIHVHAEQYQRHCPLCFDKIQALRKIDPLPVILTTMDMRNYEISFERQIVPSQSVTLLDGLHRVVAMTLNSIESGQEYVMPAFVAGPKQDILEWMALMKCA